MNVVIALFGPFRDCDPSGRLALELPDQATVADLRAAFDAYATQHWTAYRPALLQRSVFASESTVLREDEALPADGRMAVLPPVSGG